MSALRNPGELLIFGNPKKKHGKTKTRNAGGFGNHKPGCACKFCDRAGKLQRGEIQPPKLPNRSRKNALPFPTTYYQIVIPSSGVPLKFRTLAQAKKAVKPEFWGEIKKTSGNPAGSMLTAAAAHKIMASNPMFRVAGRKFKGATEKEAQRRFGSYIDKKGARAARKTLGKPKRANPRRRRHDRRNPDDMKEAVQLYQSFHGKDPKEIAEKHVSAAVRLEYAALGDLEYLRVITPLDKKVEFNFEGDGVKLASSPDGAQLYCIGGSQNLESCIEADSLEKDFVDLGVCFEVQYLARKVHGKFQPVSYYHEFGENTGERPQLMYDKLKQQIFFIGGNYFIDTSQGVSPGIEN